MTRILLLSMVLLTASFLDQSMVDVARMNGGSTKNHFSTMTPISTVEELCRDATLILHGRVRAATPQLSDDGYYVVTLLEVIPLRVYKGQVAAPVRPGWNKPVVVRRVGGTLKIEGMTLVTTTDEVSEDEALRAGEEAILFLVPDDHKAERFVALGGSFGTMRVSAREVAPQTKKAARRRGDKQKSFADFQKELIALLGK